MKVRKICTIVSLYLFILLMNGCVNDLKNVPIGSSIDETTETVFLNTTQDVETEETLNFPTENYVFDIVDKRESKTNLVGRYVAEKDSNIFFEINKSQAKLHNALGNYAGFNSGESKEQIMEIYEKEGIVWLDFRYKLKESSVEYLVRFYSKGDAFAWGCEMDQMTYLFYKE